MKTLETLYNEMIGSDELKKAFAEAVREGKLEDFLKAHDCEATEEETEAFLKERQKEKDELSDSELESVAGGIETYIPEYTEKHLHPRACDITWANGERFPVPLIQRK